MTMDVGTTVGLGKRRLVRMNLSFPTMLLQSTTMLFTMLISNMLYYLKDWKASERTHSPIHWKRLTFQTLLNT